MQRHTAANSPVPIEHAGESLSNELRRRAAAIEPAALRTYTPSLAVIARSAGSYHWTPEGRKLADFTSGVLVANLGHNPTRWWRRVLEYMGLAQVGAGDGFFSAAPLTAYNAVTELEILASERLVASLQSQPGGARMQQVLWAASGSEAIQKALWAALDRRPGSDVLLATRHGFHGKKGLAGAVTGSETDADRDPRVHFLRFPRDECASVARRRQPLDLAPYEAELSGLWSELGSRICALVTEPYLGGGGSYHPQKEYLQLLERFCRQHDIVLILDEVQANFGRTGQMYAFTHYGIEPDIVVLGKGLGNGVPVDAAVGRADLLAQMHYGEASDTWSAAPLGCAAVLATLDEFESTDVLGHARRLAGVLETGLCRLAELDVVSQVRGEGVVWGVECAAVGRHSADEVAAAAVAACYRGDAQGRAIHLLGPLAGKVLRVSPPLVMPLDEAQAYLDAMYEIFRQLGDELLKVLMPAIDPTELMRLAIVQAREGIAHGQSPFGCAIAIGDRVVAAAHNVVWATTDITAHAEIAALREACRATGELHLTGAVVATTCEPCPMCMSGLHWARVDTVHYGATIADATAAGFNEFLVPAEELVRIGRSPVRLVRGPLAAECRALFDEFLRAPDHRTY